MDAITPSILLGIAGNLATDVVKAVWRKATAYLSPSAKAVADLVTEGNTDDITRGQEKALKAELQQIMEKPEMLALLREATSYSQNINTANVLGNGNTIIQGTNNSTITIGNTTNNNGKTYNIDKIDRAIFN